MMKKLLVFLSLCIIMTSMVSAMEWDNVASYKNDDMTIEITNWLGLGETLGEATLTSHTSVDEVKYVMPGKNRLVISYEMDFTNGYTDGLGAIKMINMNNDKTITRDSYYAIGTVEKYNYTYTDYTNCDENHNNCNEEEITQERERVNWVKMSDSNIPKGTTLIGLFTDVYQGDYVDGVWEIAGKEVSKHAAWTAGYTVGLQAYYNMSSLLDSYSGGYDLVTLGADPNFTTSGCKNNLCAGFSTSTRVNLSANVLPLAQSTGETTWNFWYRGYYNATNIEIMRMSTAYNQYIEIRTNNELLIDGVASVGDIKVSPVEFNNWYMITLITNATNACGFLNGELQDCEDGVDNYEDRPTFIGNLNYLLDEMAVWNRSLSTAEIVTMYDGGTGMFFEGIDASVAMSLVKPADASVNTTALQVFNCSATGSSANVQNVSLYLDGIMNITVDGGGATFLDLETSLSLTEGSHEWSCKGTDVNNVVGWAAANYTVSIDTTLPLVTIISPKGTISSHSFGDNLSANWTITEVNLDSCWLDYNSINTTLTCADNNVSFGPVAGKQSLIIWANDSANNVNSSSTNWIYNFIENSVTSNLSTYETSTESFTLNLSTNITILSATAKLNYNGTEHTSTTTCSPNECIVTNKIDIDLILAGDSQLKSYFWNVSIVNSSGATSFPTSTRTQNVSRISLGVCDPVNNTVFVNATTYNAINPNPALNSKFKSTWFYWLGEGNIRRNNSYENLTETSNSFKFCASPNGTMYTTADFEFDATGFSQNNHYYENVSISNNTVTEQKLYLLNSSAATLTVIKVADDLQRGLVDRIVDILLFDVGTGETKIVSMAKTDHNGEDIVYLNWFDSLYQFIVRFNGTTELTVEPYKVGSTPQVFKVAPAEIFSQDKFKAVTHTLTYSTTTKEFVLIFDDPNNEITAGCLRVVQGSASNYTILSDQCSNTTSGTLSYALGTNQTGTFLAVFYAKGSFDILDSLLKVIEASGTIYDTIGNLDGSILAAILVGTATMFGVMVSGVVGILMLFLGYILAITMGYQPISILPQYLLLGGIGVYLIWKLRT